jgi:hypothetical protein
VPAGPLSRYRGLPELEVVHATRGATRSLSVRRAPPPPQRIAQRHRLAGYEPLDVLARRYFGREEMLWRLLDANRRDRRTPFVPGEVLDIPAADDTGRVRRPG